MQFLMVDRLYVVSPHHASYIAKGSPFIAVSYTIIYIAYIVTSGCGSGVKLMLSAVAIAYNMFIMVDIGCVDG